MENICLICCRGGSKGIPGKNIKEFAGKPLLGWTLEATIGSQVFDRVVVSTDHVDIADVARAFGADVPFIRPAELAKDTSDQFDAHHHAINFLALDDARYRMCVVNNNPFVSAALIHESLSIFIEGDERKIVVDAVKTSSDYMFFRQMHRNDKSLELIFHDDFLSSTINRQFDKEVFAPINNIRWAKPSWLASYKNYKAQVCANGLGFVELPKLRNFDLDDHADWQIAELVFRGLYI